MLCALLHLADTSAFEWSTVVGETPLERCARGLAGFEKKYAVPKLMDPEDIVSVPDDKGMTLYLSYIVDVLQKKNPPKKTAVSSLQRTPDRRASAPNIVVGSEKTRAGPVDGGGGFIGGPPKGSPSPSKKVVEATPSGGPPSWARRKIPDMEEETKTVSAPAIPSASHTADAPTTFVPPPRLNVPGEDTNDKLHEMEKKLEAKDREIATLQEALHQMDKLLTQKDNEKKEVEDKLQRELLAAKALSGGGGGGGGAGGVDEKKVKMAMDELKAQVDDLEQQNQMLQMSLEDSRQEQVRLQTPVVPKKGGSGIKSLLKPADASEHLDEEEILRHQLREAERRANMAEKELKDKSSSNGGLPSAAGAGGTAKEERLRKQVSELEDRISTLEQEARALKRTADKVGRLEKDLAELEERDLKHAQESRELKKQLNKAVADLEEAQKGTGGGGGTTSGQEAPGLERKKSNSKLLRSPREKVLPRPLPPGPGEK